jgi:hypothetical protein
MAIANRRLQSSRCDAESHANGDRNSIANSNGQTYSNSKTGSYTAAASNPGASAIAPMVPNDWVTSD